MYPHFRDIRTHMKHRGKVYLKCELYCVYGFKISLCGYNQFIVRTCCLLKVFIQKSLSILEILLQVSKKELYFVEENFVLISGNSKVKQVYLVLEDMSFSYFTQSSLFIQTTFLVDLIQRTCALFSCFRLLLFQTSHSEVV